MVSREKKKEERRKKKRAPGYGAGRISPAVLFFKRPLTSPILGFRNSRINGKGGYLSGTLDSNRPLTQPCLLLFYISVLSNARYFLSKVTGGILNFLFI